MCTFDFQLPHDLRLSVTSESLQPHPLIVNYAIIFFFQIQNTTHCTRESIVYIHMYYTHMWGIVYRHNISHKQTHNTQGLVGDICTLRPLRNPIECAKKKKENKETEIKINKNRV